MIEQDLYLPILETSRNLHVELVGVMKNEVTSFFEREHVELLVTIKDLKALGLKVKPPKCNGCCLNNGVSQSYH